jgi:hypothetical protein
MKLTLIRIPALLSVILLSSKIVLAADPVPKFDTGPSCRSAGAAAVMATRDTAACERDENNARATLEKEWSQFTPSDQARCVRLVTLGGGPSYVELLTCLVSVSKVVESNESLVFHTSAACEEGCRCGRARTGRATSAIICDIRAM